VPDHPHASPAKPGLPTPLTTERTQPRHRPYMIPVDASFLSAGRSVAGGPSSPRLSRHAEGEARPTSGPGGRKTGHREIAPPQRSFRR